MAAVHCSAVGTVPINRSTAPISPSSRAGTTQSPPAPDAARAGSATSARALQIQNSHLHCRMFWLATIRIHMYQRLSGNTSLSIRVLFFPPFPVYKSLLVQRFAIYLFFEYAVLLAQSMKDQLMVNSCHRWYATLTVDRVKILVISVFSTGSGVLHF